MVASDGSCGTLHEPVNPSEGWSIAIDRRNRRNSEIQEKISKLVEQALREAHCMKKGVPEVAPPTPIEEVFTRLQTTEDFKETEPILQNEPRKKCWRRMRSW
mmetsp:Transcript_1004/g.1547  ORF Transcript_1004/g.1547 Transcript_1004/m.1547 type:complete len:102 (-) Transcript_1004:23-328(-)